MIEETNLACCDCRPAAVQLVVRGLFPCAPVLPSLAVDMKMLDFYRALFVRISPNHTALSNTLERFLGERGYKLETIVSDLPAWSCRYSVSC